jgi:hypothetical protein
MQNLLNNLEEASRIIKSVDHMLYVTYPLIKEPKLFIKLLEQTHKATKKIISSILEYEYLFRRVTLFNDIQRNFKNFQEKCAPRYNITEQELTKLKELFQLIEHHTQATTEFKRKERYIILVNGSQTIQITLEKTKDFLYLARKLLKVAQDTIYDTSAENYKKPV